MKKIFLLAASAALVFASCSNDQDIMTDVNSVTDNAITFSAYTNTAVTRGEIQNVGAAAASPDPEVVGIISPLKDTDNGYVVADDKGKGIGVFAFYQGTENFNTHKFATPDFMYNQLVYNTNYADPNWQYHPVKYWPNNTGDKVSFFAYAPYEKGKQWESMGIKTDINGTKMTVTFPINQEVRDQVDQLWANPTFNQTKQATVPAGGATNGTHNIQFQFKRVTAQVSLFVGVETDASVKSPTFWNDENTEITINSVEFKGLKESITYEYALPGGSRTDIFSGSQNIKLTSDNFVAEACKIDDDKWKDATASTVWVKKEDAGDAKWKKLTTEKDYMFLAPQEFKAGDKDFEITYTVKTTATSAANCSEIKNVITKDIKDIIGAFQAGKAYKIYCLIGMTSVKFYVTVDNWADATNHQVDVPANE